MKSKKEIEERIGFPLEYREYEIYIDGNDYNNFQSEVEIHRTLEQKSSDAIKKLLIESLENGDIETSHTCERILREAEIGERELDGDFKAKREELQYQFIDKYISELENIDFESIDKNKVEEILANYNIILEFGQKQDFSDKKQQLADVIVLKIENRIQSLDRKITELRQQLEIPENEEQIDELQQEIESIEEIYVDFKAKTEHSKEMKNWEGKEITAFNHPRSEETIKKDLQRNVFNHKTKRIEEQGIDMSELMISISEYRIYGVKNLDENNFNTLNTQVVKKTQYLEQKLAFLQKYKDVPGNAERIAEIESQIETMQDSWIVAQKGYNNMDGILQTAESRKSEIQKRLALAQEEIKTIDPMSRAYLQKRNEIENLTNEVTKYEKYIDKMQQTKAEIETGESPSFIGEHHRNRLQREEQERVETNRGKIRDLEGQIAELQEHIEIPENEQKILDLQAQIDEIEATIPSDRGNHKRARLQEHGRDTETILTDIDGVVERFNDPYVDGTAKRIDAEIKTRVAYLEDKMNYLQQHLDIAGNAERVADLQSQIEQLEDKWELCTQGFGSKEQVEQRIRVTKAHLHTTLMSFKGNKDLKLSPEQMQEYWDKIQNGEEVPELFGQHHRERLEREKEARVKAEEHERNLLEQEYGLAGIQDGESLQRRLEEIVSKGIFLGADKDNDKKVAEYEKMKQVIPRFEEFKAVYLQLRQAGIEENLYTDLDFENVSFDDLLQRATAILDEKSKTEAQKQEELEIETVIEEEQVPVEEVAEYVAEESEREEVIEETPTGTGESVELDSDSMMEADLEYMRNHQAQQTSQVVEDYWNEIHSQQAKVYEQQQPEKIRPREKGIKDEVGDELKTTETQIQKQDSPSVDLWMNRFNGWYSAIDRVSQSVKEKFVKMKSDIIKAISEKLKDRTNNRQVNTQEQDTNER